MIIKRIVVHCSATRATLDIGAAEIDAMHRQRGFSRIGYNVVIRRNGRLEYGRAIGDELAHAAGYNRNSIAVCLIGGLDEELHPAANFTAEQWVALREWLGEKRGQFPDAEILGHRDLPNVAKDCPCFDVRHWLRTGTIIDPRKRV